MRQDRRHKQISDLSAAVFEIKGRFQFFRKGSFVKLIVVLVAKTSSEPTLSCLDSNILTCEKSNECTQAMDNIFLI